MAKDLSGGDPLGDMGNVSAEEVGQLIHHLQEEIKIIKQQLENLPGYASGKLIYPMTVGS
jgi:hypothetical protein